MEHPGPFAIKEEEMETVGLHVGAGIDAMATGPTPIYDELVDPVTTAISTPVRAPWWRRALAFVGLGDD